MAEQVEPSWIELTTVNSLWEEQLDENAAKGASDEEAYRHRLVRPAGQPPADWKPGPAPH